MIKITNCTCGGCFGYVVECDYCKARSTKCSNSEIDGARIFAEKKGWKIHFPKMGQSGKWICPTCQKK